MEARSSARNRLSIVYCALLATGLLSLGAAAVGQEQAPAARDIDQLVLGVQLTGPRLTRQDLEGRVVFCYHWCITCPISTGVFPVVNRLVDEYAEKGVLFIGFQVRRNPVLLEENVIWALDRLEPNFPVCRLGTDWAWPAHYLPWALVFDHEGKQIFAGNLQGITDVLDGAVARAPDDLVGGPYDRLAELAATIAADREHAGSHLAPVRAIAARAAGDAGEIAEARLMLACVERYFDRQLARAAEEPRDLAFRADVYRQLAARFAGDELGGKAAALLADLEWRPGFDSEVAAARALAEARIDLCRIPPAGYYTYDMDYHEYEDAALREVRIRQIAELRLELKRIEELYCGALAADHATELLLEYETPELEVAEAEQRLTQAEKLFDTAATPYELFEGYLLAFEVVDGYIESDDTALRSEELFQRYREARAEELDAAREAHVALDREEARIRDQVRRGGSALLREEADAWATELTELAVAAGAASRLASRAGEFIAALEESYQGHAQLGVAFDEAFEGPGARVRGVYPATAAARAGLRRGDVIVSFDGRAIESSESLSSAIESCQPGQQVEIEVRRENGDTEAVTVILGRRV